jgi:hypothetical protein
MGLTALNPGKWAGVSEQVVTGITVAAGNNSQALAVALTGENNIIGTSSATASTGVRLPAAVRPGDSVVVANQGANTTLVYPASGGKVNALATNAGFSMAAGKVATFVAVSDSNWVAILSA